MSKVQTIRTCLWFERDAEDAARLYVSLFEDADRKSTRLNSSH